MVDSYSHAYYNWREDINLIDAADYYGAVDDGAKLKSRAAIYDFFKMDPSNMTEVTCQELNKFAYQWVMENFKGLNSTL